jgi:hypothetical protein
LDSFRSVIVGVLQGLLLVAAEELLLDSLRPLDPPEGGAAALTRTGYIEAITAVIGMPFDPAAENARVDRVALAGILQEHVMQREGLLIGKTGH